MIEKEVRSRRLSIVDKDKGLRNMMEDPIAEDLKILNDFDDREDQAIMLAEGLGEIEASQTSS